MASLMQEIPNFTGTLCAQFSSINSSQDRPNMQLYSRGSAQLNLYKKETGAHIKIDSLVNFIQVDFAMSPATYVSNQTVCVD
jgi:hypothetical protein